MKKIIAVLTIVACIGTMAVGCGCNKDSEEATTFKTPENSISVVPANSTQAKKKSKKPKEVTAVVVTKSKKEKKKEKPTKTKAKGGNIVGSWTWEGGIFVYTFKKDGTGVYTTGSDAMHFKYKVIGNKVILSYKDGGDVTLPFTVNGKTLIVKDENGDDVIYYKNKKHANPNK